MPDGGLSYMDTVLLLEVKLQSLRSIAGLLAQTDDLVHDLLRSLLGVRTRSSGAILQGADIEVSFFEAIVPKVKVGPSVTQLLAS
jgi:hypothetical protein